MTENDSENAPLDTEDWQIAFEPYKGRQFEALTLSFHLAGLLKYVDRPEGVAAINRAIDVLFEYSQYRNVSYELFRLTIEGRLTTEQEDKIRKLGIKF